MRLGFLINLPLVLATIQIVRGQWLCELTMDQIVDEITANRAENR